MLATYQLRIGAPEETPPLCMQKISGSIPGRRAGKDLTGALKSCCLQSTLEYAELDGLAIQGHPSGLQGTRTRNQIYRGNPLIPERGTYENRWQP